METLSVKLKVVTPLFMSGADQGQAEIRASSIKGALRFWYRAIAFGHLSSWQEVLKAEARLFGSAGAKSGDNVGGQAKFMLKVILNAEEMHVSRDLGLKVLPGLGYLGFGLIKYDKEKKVPRVIRDCVTPGSVFELVFAFQGIGSQHGLTSADVRTLELALQALCFFGGVGSRSRRGFGSLNIIGWDASYPETIGFFGDPDSAVSLKTAIEDWQTKVDGFYTGFPDYTAFSDKTRMVVVPSENSWVQALNEIGKTFIEYRSSGQRDDKGISSEPKKNRKLPWKTDKSFVPRFWDDHDEVLKAINRLPVKNYPRRVVFGLPHNYFYRSKNANVNVNVKRLGEEQRRASPFFIHFHELKNGNTTKYAAVLTVFPARFLLQKDEIVITAGEYSKSFGPEIEVDYHIIEDLLRQYDGRLEVF